MPKDDLKEFEELAEEEDFDPFAGIKLPLVNPTITTEGSIARRMPMRSRQLKMAWMSREGTWVR